MFQAKALRPLIIRAADVTAETARPEWTGETEREAQAAKARRAVAAITPRPVFGKKAAR